MVCGWRHAHSVSSLSSVAPPPVSFISLGPSEVERMERRAGQDLTVVRACHGSEDEFLSNAECGEKCADSDVDMGDIGGVEGELPGSAASGTSVSVCRHT